MSQNPYQPDETQPVPVRRPGYDPGETQPVPTGPAHWPPEPEPTRPAERSYPPPLPGTSPHPHTDPLAETRYHNVYQPGKKIRRKRRGWGCCCLMVVLPGLLLLPLLVYLLAPLRTNILLLGVDSRPGEGFVSRTDTMILTTIEPLSAYIGMLSIPRDLWVSVPGVGENRINTAHFFAEANQAGSGPQAAMQTVRQNFGVDVHYYARLRFDGFEDLVDAMGGVDVELPREMSGYPAGVHRLNGEQALALVRDRSGSDDFFRMERGQIFLRSLARQLLKPESWVYLPQAGMALLEATDTDVPLWLWPRLGVAMLRAGPDGIDSRTITRDMVNPFTTSGGAQVLGPNWNQINPVLLEMFGQ
jgi:polyisoprenyl-teichoic acid--peptidoglycan teichoic acid transferase